MHFLFCVLQQMIPHYQVQQSDNYRHLLPLTILVFFKIHPFTKSNVMWFLILS